MIAIHSMPGHLIRRLHQISVSVFMEHMASAGFDITPVQFATLNAIAERPGMDQKSIAGLIAYDRVTIGGVIDRLEQKGLIVRTVSETDRRARVLSLSQTGRDVYDHLFTAVSACQSKMLPGLSREQHAQFLSLLWLTTEAGNAISRVPIQNDS